MHVRTHVRTLHVRACMHIRTSTHMLTHAYSLSHANVQSGDKEPPACTPPPGGSAAVSSVDSPRPTPNSSGLASTTAGGVWALKSKVQYKCQFEGAASTWIAPNLFLILPQLSKLEAEAAVVRSKKQEVCVVLSTMFGSPPQSLCGSLCAHPLILRRR